MVQKIYIARHGYRMNWVTEAWKPPTGLAKDPALAAFGETQAVELGKHFVSLPESERPTAIFSSPFYRCLQTSKPVAQALQIPLYVEHGLGEWYSPARAGSGLHPRPASATALRDFFPEIDTSWESVWMPPRQGELVDEVHKRCEDVLETLLEAMHHRLGGQHQRILLVSHAATIIALTRALAGDRKLPLRVGCCSITGLQRHDGVTNVLGAYRPLLLANGDHLAEGASRDWGFEDIIINPENGQVVEDSGVPGTENDVDHPIGRVYSPTASTQATVARM